VKIDLQEIRMTTLSEQAIFFWNSGYYCAESVLLAAAKHQGIESELVPKIATGFCSGMARTGGMCGALSGAVMALSMLYGRTGQEYDRTALYEKIQRLSAEFQEKFGSTNCSTLLGLDLGTEQGQQDYRARKLSSFCENLVGEAARMVEEALD
jgi:C_GCAxxG_C_C family probable redox protein